MGVHGSLLTLSAPAPGQELLLAARVYAPESVFRVASRHPMVTTRPVADGVVLVLRGASSEDVDALLEEVLRECIEGPMVGGSE